MEGLIASPQSYGFRCFSVLQFKSINQGSKTIFLLNLALLLCGGALVDFTFQFAKQRLAL